MVAVTSTLRDTGAMKRPLAWRPTISLRAAGIMFALLALLLTLDAIVHPQTRFDVRAINAIQRIDAPYLAEVVTFVSTLTSSFWAIAAWAVTFLVFATIRWWLAALSTLTLPVGGFLNHVVGEYVVGRTRPDPDVVTRTVPDIHAASFPSGHVMGAVMLYGMLFFIARRIERAWLRLAIQITSVAIIAATGFARVWEGAHWPTDVLGAYAYGGLFLVILFAAYTRIEAAAGHLPFVHAGPVPHDDMRRHAHALTSLVIFNADTVTKVYNPGFLPRALYWLAFQARFPYERNLAALHAAQERRNLAAMLTMFWFGEERVARVLRIEHVGDQPALTSALVHGTAPADRHAARQFLRELRAHFEAAGLPTWQIDPRQPRAVDNILETTAGHYVIVDLESGLVSPLAPLRSWARAVRRGHVPLFDTVFFDVTRAYIDAHADEMRAAQGEAWFAALNAQLDAAEAAADAWYAGEPRLIGKLVHVRTWKQRLEGRLAIGQAKALRHLSDAVEAWESDGRISHPEATALRAQMETPQFQAVLPHLGAHVIITVFLRFPFGSIARAGWTAWALLAATGRVVARRSSVREWRQAWSIHNPLVMLLAAIPGFGAFAYLAAGPVRSNRLLVRVTFDALMFKVPWRLYERTGLRRVVVIGRATGKHVNLAPDATNIPAWESQVPAPAFALAHGRRYGAVEGAAWD
jgi:membrane-associated phospholipid phosphatase